MTASSSVRRLVDDLLDGGSVGQFGGFLGPVLGEQGDQPIRQRLPSSSRAAILSGAVLVGGLTEVVLLIQQVGPDERREQDVQHVPGPARPSRPVPWTASSNSDRMAERMCLATISGLRRLKAGASMAPPSSRSGSSKK